MVLSRLALAAIVTLELAGAPFPTAPPANGLLYQAGGLMTSWWGYAVDFDRRTITTYATSGRNRVITGTDTLAPAAADEISALAKRAIAEDKATFPPIADVNFRLDLSVRGRVATTNTYGPVPASGGLHDLHDVLQKYARR